LPVRFAGSARRPRGAAAWRRGVVALALAVAALPGRAAGQGAPWLPRLRLDNDSYNFWLAPGDRTDEEYTNGVVASLETLGAPWWGKRLGGGHPACAHDTRPKGTCLTTLVSLSQDIYTPNLHRPPFSTPDWQRERPYAAWLALGGEGRRVTARSLRTMSLAVGVTGRPALGELAQSIAHHITAAWTVEAKGWETQVGFEPGVIAGYRQSLLAARGTLGGRRVFDVVPTAGVSLGNILTNADVGARARLGINLSHPWDPRAWRRRAPWEFHVSAGGRLEYVARNFSLDGTLLSPERQVDRRPGVSEYEFGAGVRVQRLNVGWRAVTRSREYTTGPARFTWSSMYAGVEFYR
jgi:lipid A 3-O-deacylase